MKVELIKEEKDKKEINYPCLMQYNKEGDPFVVLFIGKSKGVVVSDCTCCYVDYWDMSDFIPYKGKVVLEND